MGTKKHCHKFKNDWYYYTVGNAGNTKTPRTQLKTGIHYTAFAQIFRI